MTGAENYYLRATDYWITYADMEFADKNEHYLWIGHWMGFYEFPTVKQVEAAYGSPLGGYITKNATYTVTEISDDNYQTATLTFDAVGANSPGQKIHVEAKWRAKWVGDYHLVPLHRGQTPQP